MVPSESPFTVTLISSRTQGFPQANRVGDLLAGQMQNLADGDFPGRFLLMCATVQDNAVNVELRHGKQSRKVEIDKTLLGGPFGVGIRRNVEVNHLSPVVMENDEDVQDAKRDCGNSEEVAGGDIGNVIYEERSPSLGWSLSLPDHVFGHGCFSDIVAQQGQFGYDPRCAPRWVFVVF